MIRAAHHASKLQELMHSTCSAIPGAGLLPGSFRVHGRFDAEHLRRSVARLMERHPALRTSFEERAGGLEAVVHPHLETPFTVHDAAGWSDAEVTARVTASVSVPLDLATPPLFRAALFERSATDRIFAMAVHHAIIDGRSLAALMDDVQRLCDSPASELPPVEATWEEWVALERRRLESETGKLLRSYWRRALADAPRVELRRAAPGTGGPGATPTAVCPPALVGRLAALGRRHGASLFTVLLAACHAVLHRHTGAGDAVIGSPVSLRWHRRFARVCGPLYDYLPLRADPSRDPTFDTFLASVRATVAGAFTHVGYPSACMVEDVRGDPRRGLSSLFQVMLNVLPSPVGLAPLVVNEPGHDLPLGRFRLESLVTLARFVPLEQNDLTIVAGPVREGFMIRMFYEPGKYDGELIAGMLGEVVALLEEAAVDSHRRLSTFTARHPARVAAAEPEAVRPSS